MNISFILGVLTMFVAYLIYDMLKKNKQEQQIVLQQQKNASITKGKLKPSYASECKILKQLNEEKGEEIKHKSISIHLQEVTEEKMEVSHSDRLKIKELIAVLSKTHRIYVLIKQNVQPNNELLSLLRAQHTKVIPFNTIQGAVAVLRQLSCHLHLQSNIPIYNIIIQYLSNVWVLNSSKESFFTNQVATEVQLLLSLNQVVMGRDQHIFKEE